MGRQSLAVETRVEAVMTAVRLRVPVLGANLPRDQMSASMNDNKLDAQLPARP